MEASWAGQTVGSMQKLERLQGRANANGPYSPQIQANYESSCRHQCPHQFANIFTAPIIETTVESSTPESITSQEA
jgi:hypothetical protein